LRPVTAGVPHWQRVSASALETWPLGIFDIEDAGERQAGFKELKSLEL